MDAPRRPTVRLPPVPTALRRSGRIGVFERDLRSGAGRWDAGMFALYGFEPVGGVPPLEATLARVHEDDRERVLAFHAELRAGRRAHGDTRFCLRHGDGRRVHLRAYVDVHFDEQGAPQLLRGVLIDETDTAAEVQAARERSAQLAQAIALADLTVWRIDLATRQLHVDAADSRLRGQHLPQEGFALEDVRRLVHPDDLAQVRASFDEALRSHAPVDVLLRCRDVEADLGGDIDRYLASDALRAADVRWRWLLTRRAAARDAQGRPTQLHGITIDLTELVAERERAAAQSQRLATITDAAGIGTFSRDIDSGELSWSATQRELYGLLPDDPLPNWAEYLERHVHPEDRARLAAEVERADASGQAVRHHDFRIRAADGRERWIYAWSGREAREGRRWAFGVHVDVTDRHVAEAERRQRERLEQAARAQAALLARVSHELRTPMNAVLGFAEVLAGDRARHPLDAVQAGRVESIRHAGRHLLSLIDDLLELAAVDAADREPQCQPVALATVAAQALPWVSTLAAQHGVHIEAPVRLAGTVRADPRGLLQVTSNLLTNAVKYNRRGGRVWLDSRRRTRGGQRGWQLVVGDSGRGLSAEQRARLFQPFERLGAELEGIAGSGIGLAIVQRLVERMGGCIEVDSTPGSGSEFCVWLPATGEASAGQAATAAVPQPRATAAGSAPLTVLCIEDNAVNCSLIEALFAMRPQQTVLRMAADGASGLALARAEPPDLLLLDMQLPDLHGLEVLRRLRTDPRTAGCTVIGLSANVLAEDIQAALAAGCDDYWTKPIDVPRFLAGIDAQIARRTGMG